MPKPIADIARRARPLMKPELSMQNRPLWAEISPARLKHNLEVLRSMIGERVKLCIVAKANCYGHSLPHCLPVILGRADSIATATAWEALEVRRMAPCIPVHVLLPLALAGHPQFARRLIEEKIDLTVSSADDVSLLRVALSSHPASTQVHVKIDTGMSRSGVLPEAAPKLVWECRRMKGVRVAGVFTDLATADENKATCKIQLRRFEKTLRAIGGRDEIIAHAAASAATLDLPESHYDMVRIGVSTFGYLPSPHTRSRVPLRGVMRLLTRLIQIKDVRGGTGVGYGLTYQFARSGRLGLVPVGYADGYDRRFTNQTQMRIRGQWVPVRGRVSMDQTSIDLSGVAHAEIGDEVEVISWNREDPSSIENLAQIMGSIPNEVTTHLGHRIHFRTVSSPL